MANSKTVGILGGMGPHATAAFFQTLLNLTPAKKDWEHLRVIIDDNPHIPSRTRHLLYGEASPLKGMIDACRKLEQYPVDLIALPCNSASIFIPEIEQHVRVPILNIIAISANALARTFPTAKRTAVIGGYVTYKTESYKPFLAANGIELIDHGAEIQEQVERQIESLKLGQSSQANIDEVSSLIDKLKSKFGADSLILACTEFGCLPPFDRKIPTVDSSTELARYTIQAATK